MPISSSQYPVVLLCDFCERDGPTIIFSTTMWSLNEFESIKRFKDVCIQNENQNSYLNINHNNHNNQVEKKEFNSQLSKELNSERINSNRNEYNSHLSENLIELENEDKIKPKISLKEIEKELINLLDPEHHQKINDEMDPNIQSSICEQDFVPSNSTSSILNNSFYSIDEAYLYLSNNYLPFKQTELVTKYNQICLRSLSGEHVGPGKEGACVFGDSVQGFTFNFVFKIKDIKARGQIRWMSLCFITSTLSDLILNWPFLKNAMKSWTKKIKKISSKIFSEERSNLEKELESMRLTGQEPTLRGLSSSSDHSFSHTIHAHSMVSRQSSVRKVGIHSSKRGQEKLRPLPILLRNDDFFKILHVNICFIQKAYVKRFYIVNDNSRIKEQIQDTYSFLDLYQTLKENVSDYKKIIENIIYHVSIGDQLIIRGSDVASLKLILPAFHEIVPKQSIRSSSENFDKYIPSYQANFLIIHSSVNLNIDENNGTIDPSCTLVLDIESQLENNGNPIIISLKPFTPIQDSVPRTSYSSILIKLLQTCKTKNTFQSSLKVTIHQLVSRAKIFSQISRQTGHTSSFKDSEQAFLNLYGYSQIDSKVLRNFISGQNRRKTLKIT